MDDAVTWRSDRVVKYEVEMIFFVCLFLSFTLSWIPVRVLYHVLYIG